MFLKIKKSLLNFLAKFGFSNLVHFINGIVKLPPPLTKQEEEDIFKKIAQNLFDYLLSGKII